MLLRVSKRCCGGALPKFGFSKAVSRALALFLFLSLSAVAQVITFTNKAVTFTTLEGTAYSNVNLVKAYPMAYPGVVVQVEAGWPTQTFRLRLWITGVFPPITSAG